MDTAFPDEGAKHLTNVVLQLAEGFVPKKSVVDRKSTHPWLNERVVKLVQSKEEAEGTERELEAAEACSTAVLEEYRTYVSRTKAELAGLRAGSKK